MPCANEFPTSLMQASSSGRAVIEYVFPGANGVGRITEQRKQMDRVTETYGVSFTIYDLRRIFITIAERLDIPAYALKRLLNHKMNNDVTAGYIISDVERLRPPCRRSSITYSNAPGLSLPPT